MYKRITIIEELKKEFVIASNGKEYLIEVNKNIKKFENGEHIKVGKERTTVIEGSEILRNEPNHLIAEGTELDRINRQKIQEEEKKRQNTKIEKEKPKCLNEGCKYSKNPRPEQPLCNVCVNKI